MVTAIDRVELVRLITEEEAQVVDVLPDSEYTGSHIPGAISLPLRHLTAESVSMLRRDRPVAVY